MPLGICLARAGSLLLLLLLLREVEERELSACCRRPFPASPCLLTLPNSHRTFHDVSIRGSHQSLAPAFYPPAIHALRGVDRGWIRGLGLERVALVDVAVALALAPLPVRGQEVMSVGGGHRPRHALLVVARGLVPAAALGVEALGRVVTGLDPRIDTGHAVTALDVSGRGLLTATAPAVERTRSPARRGERRDRSRSHALPSRSRDRLRSSVRLPASPARLRTEEAGRLARRGAQEGVEALASQPPVASGEAADVTPVAGGASMTALPSAMRELAKFFLNLSGSSSL